MFPFVGKLRESLNTSNLDTEEIKSKILKDLEKSGVDLFKVDFDVNLDGNAVIIETKNKFTERLLQSSSDYKDRLEMLSLLMDVLQENSVTIAKNPIWLEKDHNPAFELEFDFRYKDIPYPFLMNIKEVHRNEIRKNVVIIKIYLAEQSMASILTQNSIVFSNWENNDWEIIHTIVKLITFNLDQIEVI